MKSRFAPQRRHMPSLVLCTLWILPLLLSACGGNPQTQQQVSQAKNALNISLAHAQRIGVPASLLQPIIAQRDQLNGTHAPLGLFGDQSVNDYYQNVRTRYSQLQTQVLGLEDQISQQSHYQAYMDLQSLTQVLGQVQSQHTIDTTAFAHQLANEQQNLLKAQLPRDYLDISANAKRLIQALHLVGPAYSAYSNFQDVIKQLKTSHVDVTGFVQESQMDLQTLQQSTQPDDLSKLIDQINAQMNETTTISVQAIPYVGQVKLNQFSADIQLIQHYGDEDTSTYQQHFRDDQQALNQAKTTSEYLRVSAQIDADINAIRFPLAKAQAKSLLQQFHREVASWGHSHQYHNPFNGQFYPLDFAYDQQGIGSDVDAELQAAQSLADYQAVIETLNNDLLELHMSEQDYSDKTPDTQPHQSDLTLMKQYGVSNASEVLVVSLVKQVMRYYEHGKLVRTFSITSGQYLKPSPPGFYSITMRRTHWKFSSSEPKGSAFWYPDTPINYAMLYRSDGYFFHDSWWRVDYGPGTEFPHYDSGGDESFAGNGSHGCINMRKDQIAWLYARTDYNAVAILY